MKTALDQNREVYNLDFANVKAVKLIEKLIRSVLHFSYIKLYQAVRCVIINTSTSTPKKFFEILNIILNGKDLD